MYLKAVMRPGLFIKSDNPHSVICGLSLESEFRGEYESELKNKETTGGGGVGGV